MYKNAYTAQCLKDMESYGLTTPSILKKMLTTSENPIETIKTFQEKNSIPLDSLKPALKFLDLAKVRRTEFHETVFNDLVEKLLQKIRSLGENPTPEGNLALEHQLDACFKLYRVPRIRPIVLETLKQLPNVADRYLRLIVCDSELYKSCHVSVRRQIWVKNNALFLEDVSAVIVEYLEAKEKMLLSIDRSSTNFFTRDTTRIRRQWPQIRELISMIGDQEVLYKHLISEIQRRFIRTRNCHLCSLRLELLMALHQFSVEYATRIDPCHDFAWYLDTCVRDKHIDSQQASKLRNILDSSRKELSEAMGHMAMIARDPHVVHFLSRMAVRILRDSVNACNHLPRENLSLHLILRLLYFGVNAMKIIHNELPSQAVIADCLTRFLPSFAYLMTENLLRYELQQAPEEISDEFYGELPIDESMMETIVHYLREDEVCALLWLHYLLDVMPSKRHFLLRNALFRYIQYLPVLANRFGSSDPWIHLFLHRLIQSDVHDSIISDESIARKIIQNLLLEEIKTDYAVKFHLLRLCMHLRSNISDEYLKEANDAFVKLHDDIMLQDSTLISHDDDVESKGQHKLAHRKWDDFFLQELEKYKAVMPGVIFASSSAVEPSFPVNYPASSSLSAEAVAAASLGD